MATPNPKRQKIATNMLDGLYKDPSNVWVVHYSCESFHNRREGRSPRVTSIALCKLDTDQATSFSIHKVAERRQVPFSEIRNHYDDLEKEMIQDFFLHLSRHQGVMYVHWNMRDSNYGFQAIAHRFQVLGGDPSARYEVEESKKVDLFPIRFRGSRDIRRSKLPRAAFVYSIQGSRHHKNCSTCIRTGPTDKYLLVENARRTIPNVS